MENMRDHEVAERIGVALGTLRSWRHRGEGPRWFKLGSKAVRYRRSDVEAWLQEAYDSTVVGA